MIVSRARLERDDAKLLAATEKASTSVRLFSDVQHHMAQTAAELVKELARAVTIAGIPIIRPAAGGPGAPYSRGF